MKSFHAGKKRGVTIFWIQGIIILVTKQQRTHKTIQLKIKIKIRIHVLPNMYRV